MELDSLLAFQDKVNIMVFKKLRIKNIGFNTMLIVSASKSHLYFEFVLNI